MRTGPVSMPPATGSSGIPGYAAWPDGTPAGGIVVIQEAFGVTNHIKSICERLATEGFITVTPELFHRHGSPTVDYHDIETAQGLLANLNPQDLSQDIDAAERWLSAEGIEPSKISIIGFCMGGTVAFWEAVRHSIGAAVTFYGSGIDKSRFGLPPLLEIAPNLQTPWLGLYGDQDSGIPVDRVEALREEAERAAVPTEIIRYSDAGHAFNNDDRSDKFHEASATDAWQKMVQWIHTNIHE